eukprot:7686819-Alexandrium_andersonii.AAC.1
MAPPRSAAMLLPGKRSRRLRALSRQLLRDIFGSAWPAQLKCERGRGPRLRSLGCHTTHGS